MKKIVLLLLLLVPAWLFAQKDSLSTLPVPSTDEILAEAPPASLNWSDRREPFIAGFLSYMIPGLGQIYNRQYEKGAGILTFMAFSGVMAYRSGVTDDEGAGAVFAGVGMAGAWLYSLIDAVSSAKQINRSIELQRSKQISLSVGPDLLLTRQVPALGVKVSLSL